jgi:hypothetical protein
MGTGRADRSLEGEVTAPRRQRKGRAHPRARIELTITADHGLETLVRSVAAEIADGEGADPPCVQQASDAAGGMVQGLLVDAATDTHLRCRFSIYDRAMHLHFSMDPDRVSDRIVHFTEALD